MSNTIVNGKIVRRAILVDIPSQVLKAYELLKSIQISNKMV